MKTLLKNIKISNQLNNFKIFYKIRLSSFSISFNKNPIECYYKTLNSSPSAVIDDIKQEYYKLAKKYHPDNNNSNSNENQAVNNINIINLRINLKLSQKLMRSYQIPRSAQSTINWF